MGWAGPWGHISVARPFLGAGPGTRGEASGFHLAAVSSSFGISASFQKEEDT